MVAVFEAGDLCTDRRQRCQLGIPQLVQHALSRRASLSKAVVRLMLCYTAAVTGYHPWVVSSGCPSAPVRALYGER